MRRYPFSYVDIIFPAIVVLIVALFFGWYINLTTGYWWTTKFALGDCVQLNTFRETWETSKFPAIEVIMEKGQKAWRTAIWNKELKRWFFAESKIQFRDGWLYHRVTCPGPVEVIKE